MTGNRRVILPPGLTEVGEQAVLYCDESGNSGPNYLDEQQPFYVLSGWVIPDRSNEQAWVAIERLRQRMSPQSDELKASHFLKGERQKLEAVSLFRELGSLGAIPLFLIAEKRFCIAAKIVETFLDPFYNPLLRNGITSDRETKQELANLLHERMPRAVMVQFAEAYRRPDGSGLRDALHAVADSCRQHLSPEMADALLGSASEIDQIAEAEAASSPLGNVAASLNMPCLVSFLMMAEFLGRMGHHRPIRFVHDRQHAYEAGYRKIFELHRGIPNLFTSMPGDDASFSTLTAVAEFETADSKERLPIQAADALAGIINHLMRLAMSGNQPTDADVSLATMTLPALFIQDMKLAWPIWSDDCIKRVGESLIVKALRPAARTDLEIQKAKAIASARIAPVLPVLLGTAVSSHPFKIPCPIYAIRGRRSRALMLLVPTDEDRREANGEARPVVPLFSSNAAAESFLGIFTELTEPQEIVSFDGADVMNLVEGLDTYVNISDLLVFDPGTEQMHHMYMPAFVETMRAMLRRIRRLLCTGLDQVVLKRHDINGRAATSMLLADGRYGAMWSPVGDVVVAATREEALQALSSVDSSADQLPLREA